MLESLHLFSANMSSSKKKKKKKPTTTTTTRVNSERDGNELWQIVTDHPDIFGRHVVPKLNGNDAKFFYDVNAESRAAIKRSGVQLRDAFKIEILDTKSTQLGLSRSVMKRRNDFGTNGSKWRLRIASIFMRLRPGTMDRSVAAHNVISSV